MKKNLEKNILIIAYACEPNQTSEPGVGWNFSSEISNFVNTTVITRSNNRAVIEENLNENDQRSFIYYDLPPFFTKIKKKIPLGSQIYFLLWQFFSYLHIRKLIKNKKIDVDLIHQLTFGTSWINPPSFLLNKKFIWGPIGGGDFVSSNFLKELRLKALLQELLYISLNKLSRVSPFHFLLKNNISTIIFRTESLQHNYTKLNKKINSYTISETANISPKVEDSIHISSEINAMCVGRMTYWKGFIYAVKGFHIFLEKGGKGKLNLFGNGPELNKIKEYITEHNLSKNIIVHGFVDNNEVKKNLLKSNLLIHPSFREGGSWSIMEAMNYGLPVVCLNTSGPKDMVTKDCGILLDFNSPNSLVTDMGNKIFNLSQNLKLFTQLSDNARNRIDTEYTWSKRGKQIFKIYKEVFNEKN